MGLASLLQALADVLCYYQKLIFLKHLHSEISSPQRWESV